MDWVLESAQYPATDGWVIEYSIVSATEQHSFTSTTVDGKHNVVLDAATTGVYGAGEYFYQAVAKKDTSAYPVETGTLLVKRKKPQSKPRPYVVRAYAGADGGRLFGSWTATDSSADEAVQYRLRTLRNRARQLAEDNEYIKRYLSLLKTNVVGPNGVILQVKAKDYRVDGTAKLDTKANAWLEEGYKRWCKKKWCSATRRHNMVTMQNLAISSIARDGEVFAVRVREKDKSNP